MKRIAIVGAASSSIHVAPWDDLDASIWSPASILKYWPDYAPRVDVFFELHRNFFFIRPDWLGWAIAAQPKVYMADKNELLTNAEVYPIDSIVKQFGRYFTSTIAYMMALAITKKPEWIGLYGIDMAMGSEYHHQRPCCEYLIGLARGMGIEVEVPETSDLLKSPWLYGYDKQPESVDDKTRDELATWRSEALALRELKSA